MSAKHRQKKVGSMMLFIVVCLYLLATFSDHTLAYKALLSSIDILITIIPVLTVVLLLMTFINSFIESKKISRCLGERSGIKEWFIALAGGVFSHGPGYVWYPMLSDLREHGVKDGLIVAFFYARSIKIPWLPMMASYFGIAFTVILTLFILFAALLQGMIAERLISNDK